MRTTIMNSRLARRLQTILGAFIAAMALMLVAPAGASATEPPDKEVGSDLAGDVPPGVAPAPFPGDAAEVSKGTAQINGGGMTKAKDVEMLACTFYTKGDYVHKSSGQASGHGWWENVNCNTTYADVTIYLQQYYSDGVWRKRGSTDEARVVSGGGKGKRATARSNCATLHSTGWRSVVDVDLVGIIDSPEKLYTSARNISCRRA